MLLDDLEGCLLVGGRTLVRSVPPRNVDGVRAGFLHYRHKPVVPWCATGLLNVEHHLALVCQSQGYLAFYLSEPSARRRVERLLGDPGAGEALQHLSRVPPGRINAAFLRGAATRTLWLSGLHHPTSVKADSKVLSGEDLRDALDPLEDQTYAFSAARSRPEAMKWTVGVAPRKSTLWTGPTKSWPDFRGVLKPLLGELAATTDEEEAPLPVLAVPATDPSGIGGAFDVSFQPPELLTADVSSLAPVELAELERWAYRATFEVIECDGPDFTATLCLEGEPLLDAAFSIDLASPERVSWEASVEEEHEDADAEDLEAAKSHCQRPDWLVVRYDSGHVLASGALYQVRHRDIPFSDWQWVDLSGHDVGREKPSSRDALGQEDSLFCWVHQCWPPSGNAKTMRGGWLACDDGAMEIADFVHLDEGTTPPTLSLIHVKASKKTEPDRPVAVSDYEIVTSQAIKNLRFLDRLLLDEGLRSGLTHRVGSLVWKDREESTRKKLLSALGHLGMNFRRRVVILQPRMRRTAHEHARSHPGSMEARRLTQLDTLLLAARASVNGLGAELLVLGEDDT